MLLTRVVSRIALVCGALVLTLPVGTASAAYPPRPPVSFGPALTTQPSTVVAGASFQAVIVPCTKGTIVPMTFEGRTINAVCTNPEAVAEFRAPGTPGVYVLTAVLNGRTVRRQVLVISGSSSSGMPNTGTTTEPSLLMSVATSTALTGVALTVVARRRRAVHS